MTRRQRHTHLIIWLGLAPLLAVIIYLALSLYGAGDPSAGPLAETRHYARLAGLAAFILLSLILMIGPLARLSPVFRPLIKIRRYLGVTTFFIALAHAVFVLFWGPAGFGLKQPLERVFQANPDYSALSGFPFESLGVAAFVILFALAMTSLNLWNKLLGPRLWKALHMSVYFAYALLVAHIAFGVVALGKSPLYLAGLAISAGLVCGVHIITGLASLKRPGKLSPDGWILVAKTADMPCGRAIIIKPPTGELIAVFRETNKIIAVSNNCPHQGGPLGEGTIQDGCITCPWHGFKFDAADGTAQSAAINSVQTYPTKVIASRIYVYPIANPLDAPTPPGRIDTPTSAPVYG